MLPMHMYETPAPTGFTIYSKSGCDFCKKAKQLLGHHRLSYIMVDCDEYILDDKAGFLQFMETLAGKPVKSFPMIFYNGGWIGGFLEMKDLVDTMMLFSNDF